VAAVSTAVSALPNAVAASPYNTTLASLASVAVVAAASRSDNVAQSSSTESASSPLHVVTAEFASVSAVFAVVTSPSMVSLAA